jgi:hypothetical protein
VYIKYDDANNLYGHAMSQPLPVNNYNWINPVDFDAEKILNLPDDGSTGYIFEVDLEYPAHLHKLHNDYPLCPQSKIVTDNLLSEYQHTVKQKLKIHSDHTKKLLTDVTDKYNYRIHYRALKQALQMGLILKKFIPVYLSTSPRGLKNILTKTPKNVRLQKMILKKTFSSL